MAPAHVFKEEGREQPVVIGAGKASVGYAAKLDGAGWAERQLCSQPPTPAQPEGSSRPRDSNNLVELLGLDGMEEDMEVGEDVVEDMQDGREGWGGEEQGCEPSQAAEGPEGCGPSVAGGRLQPASGCGGRGGAAGSVLSRLGVAVGSADETRVMLSGPGSVCGASQAAGQGCSSGAMEVDMWLKGSGR
ncbi:hypothetical protein V8C86DRAFT_3098744 [Haematococcus lacustris]